MASRPLVLQLQADAMDHEVPVAALLRRAKVVATKLDLPEMLQWVDRELDGFYNLPDEALPTCRKIAGYPKARDPYTGRWMPIYFKDRSALTVHVRDPVAILQSMLAGKGALAIPKSPSALGLDEDFESAIFVNRNALENILDRVRTVIVDWTLKLEALGVKGDNMSFSENEKRSAQQATSTVINAGSIGAVGFAGSGGNSMVNQTFNVENPIDFKALIPLLQSAIGELSAADKKAASSAVSLIEAEAELDAPDKNLVGATLSRIAGFVERASSSAAGGLLLAYLKSQGLIP